MDNIIIVAIGGLVATGLLIKIALLNARLEGHREAQRQLTNGTYDHDKGDGCLKILAVIGFLAICGLCFYVGLGASAWPR